MEGIEGRTRVVIKSVQPEIECGRFPIKKVIGEKVDVEAIVFADGHDSLSAVLLYRKATDAKWNEAAMKPAINDRWSGSFTVEQTGRYIYTIIAWIDRFKSWRADMEKRIEAGQTGVQVNVLIGAQQIADASQRAEPAEKRVMKGWVVNLQSADVPEADKIRLIMGEEVAIMMGKYANRKFAETYPKQLEVVVDRPKALFGSWYEMFPRSTSSVLEQHGTFKDCQARLPYVAGMGFDVLYLPPIHPIGRTNRKGKNNALVAGPVDPGTPWAIGGEEGGHKAINPEFGNLDDFHQLLDSARKNNIELALDMAFQCSPDHPYVKEHPEWFIWRPDGTIQYAENPPKKYQDIYPLNFENDNWKQLWEELKNVIVFWIEQGVQIFRVDNPHTKPFRFWEWLINEIKDKYPDVIFLAEAFTRPNVMYHLAKLGFTQSYTYFAWRNTKWEITQYFNELSKPEISDFFKPNLWPNTPDILTEFLQSGGKPAFMARLVLAATLGASYGIYGPAFELYENRPKEPGSEEYLDSEKYEIKHWDINRPDSLRELITRVNQIRRENSALQSNVNLNFHVVDNERLLCYSKHDNYGSDIILTVVNLDPHHTHSGWVNISLEKLGMDSQQPFQVHDLLSGARYLWQGERNYVELNPQIVPAHIFHILRRVRSEHDFDYYL